jgi:uroporphyrin-3 C-methyltransferase
VTASQQAAAKEVKALLDKHRLSNAEIQQLWAIAEIKSLLSTANQRLLLAGDIKAAITALELADKRVEILDDYRLFPLRSLLAQEIMELEALVDLDIEGVVHKLQSALGQVEQIQVVSGPAVSQKENESAAETSSSWQQAASGVWKQVRSLVVIRHKQDGSNAVLVPEQRYFLYQNLRLQLETARYALMRNEANLYKESLGSAIEWLNEYFVGERRDALLATLTELQQQPINISMPDISGSSTWLKQQEF